MFGYVASAVYLEHHFTAVRYDVGQLLALLAFHYRLRPENDSATLILILETVIYVYLKHIIMEYHFLSTKRNDMVRELDKIVPEFEKQDIMKAIMGGKIPRTNMRK